MLSKTKYLRNLNVCLMALHSVCFVGCEHANSNEVDSETPEGYYAFVESPKMEPPQVKLPPYIRSNRPCPGVMENRLPLRKLQNNLCGDLNKGIIPVNPMRQNIYGSPYPFELINNRTLEYFSRTLPILKSDETIPRITSLNSEPQYYLYQNPNKAEETHSSSPEQNSVNHLRYRRNAAIDDVTMDNDDLDRRAQSGNFSRQSRKICENDNGFLCLIFKLIQGQVFRSLVAQKRHDTSAEKLEYRTTNVESNAGPPPLASMSNGPPTPCPAKVEYVTPVFARNYQGVWRYVVQIPYEGYFTQTVEVTKCISGKCYYVEGGCLSSPRWVSLLVAEIYYPDSYYSVATKKPPVYRHPIKGGNPPPLRDFHRYQQFHRKRDAIPSFHRIRRRSASDPQYSANTQNPIYPQYSVNDPQNSINPQYSSNDPQNSANQWNPVNSQYSTNFLRHSSNNSRHSTNSDRFEVFPEPKYTPAADPKHNADSEPQRDLNRDLRSANDPQFADMAEPPESNDPQYSANSQNLENPEYSADSTDPKYSPTADPKYTVDPEPQFNSMEPQYNPTKYNDAAIEPQFRHAEDDDINYGKIKVAEQPYPYNPPQYSADKVQADIKTSTSAPNSKRTHCDGTDEFGCFQVRLYYDWFLVPGSCKCWRPDYFAKYTRWKGGPNYEL